MTNTNFRLNIFNILKQYGDDYEKGIVALKSMEDYKDSPYKNACYEGALYYLAEKHNKDYKIRDEFILPEKVFTEGVDAYVRITGLDTARDMAILKADKHWLAYNIVTEGVDTVC